MLGFPESWHVTPTATREGGRDAKGRPLPDTTRSLPRCLVAPTGTTDPSGDWSAVLDGSIQLYADEPLDLTNGDVVTIPAGQYMAGRWTVDGRPQQWPMGDVVRLVSA